MKIFNANLEVTNATVQDGEIKDLEINRQNIPLASSVKLEANKTVAITENGTVEITPTSGKDAMEKVTVDVNITNAGVVTFYAWECTEYPNIGLLVFTLSSTPEVGNFGFHDGYDDGEVYSNKKWEVVSVGENSITCIDVYNQSTEQIVLNRNSTEDIVYDSTSND